VGCTQANLTPDWVRLQVTAGRHLIPLYVGPQASCTKASAAKNLIDNARAAEQGTAAAQDAAARAAALGLAEQSVLIHDRQAYRTDDPLCRAGVPAFLSAWTIRLHDLGYLSGFHSSIGSQRLVGRPGPHVEHRQPVLLTRSSASATSWVQRLRVFTAVPNVPAG
jgi:hypothetical protein